MNVFQTIVARWRSAILVVAIVCMAPFQAAHGAEPASEMFLTRAEYADITIKGKKQDRKRWIPTKDKIGFAWSDQPFAVHIPFDSKPGTTLKLHLRGFGDENLNGLWEAPMVSAGVYRADGQPVTRTSDDTVQFVYQSLPAPPNLDAKGRDKDKPARLSFLGFEREANVRYVYWIVLDPRARTIPENERVVEFGYKVNGVSPSYWSKHAECKGAIVATFESGDAAGGHQSKVDVSILQNNWQISDVREELLGDWKKEIAKGWKAENVKTQFKDGKLTSVHRIVSGAERTEVTISLPLPAMYNDHQSWNSVLHMAQTSGGTHPRYHPFGVVKNGAFALLRVYSYAEDPRAPAITVQAGPSFRQMPNFGLVHPFYCQLNGNDYQDARDPITGLYRWNCQLPLRLNSSRSDREPFLKMTSDNLTALPGNWTADQSTAAHRLFSLDILLDHESSDNSGPSIHRPRPADTPAKRIDVVARRFSNVKDNIIGKTVKEPVRVVEEIDDGYHEWTVRFEALKTKNLARLKAIHALLGIAHARKQEKLGQWLELLKIDQLSFPAEPAQGGDLLSEAFSNLRWMTLGANAVNVRPTLTKVELEEMKRQRDVLKAEMEEIRPEQEKLIHDGLRLVKELCESVDVQISASRGIHPRPTLRHDLDFWRDQLAVAKLTMYDAAGWYGPDDLQKLIEDYRFPEPDARDWLDLLKARAAWTRAAHLEQILSVQYAMPNRPEANNPNEQAAGQARLEALLLVKGVLRRDPKHEAAVAMLQGMELELVGRIADKLEREKRMTAAAFEQWLKNRGYSLKDPENNWEAAQGYFWLVFGHGATAAFDSVKWPLLDKSVIDQAEDKTSRQLDEIATHHLSLIVIRQLVRAGLPLAEIRVLTPNVLKKHYEAHTVVNKALDPQRIDRLCHDVRGCFSFADLGSLAEGRYEDFVGNLARDHFHYVNSSLRWYESMADEFLSPKAYMLFRMRAGLAQYLAKTSAMEALTELIAGRPVGKWLIEKFVAYHEYRKGISWAMGFAQGTLHFAAVTTFYCGVSYAVHDIAGVRELVDFIILLGPLEMLHESLLSKGLTPTAVAERLKIAEAKLAAKNAELAEIEKSLKELEDLHKTVTGAGTGGSRRPNAQQKTKLDGIKKRVGPNGTPILPNPTRAPAPAPDRIQESLRDAIAAIEDGKATEAGKALVAGREHLRQLREGFNNLEAKIAQARKLLASKGMPHPLTQAQEAKFALQPVDKSKPGPFILKNTYPVGPHGKFIQFGDLAVIQGDLDRALELYQAALKTRRMHTLPNPDDLIEKRILLVLAAQKEAKELELMSSRGVIMRANDDIPADIEQILAKRRLDIKPNGESGANESFFVTDTQSGERYFFKKIENTELADTELMAVSLARGAKLKAPAVRKVLLNHNGAAMQGLLYRHLEGTELYKLTEGQLLAMKDQLAQQRVLRLWVGDTDGQLRNIFRGKDGHLWMLDFGYANLEENLNHQHWPMEMVFGRRIESQEELMQAMLAFPDLAYDVIGKDPRYSQFRWYKDVMGWMKRIDEMTSYNKMEDAVKAINDLCFRNQGKDLERLLKATGIKDATKLTEAFKVLRFRAELLEKVLKRRFPTLPKPAAVMPRLPLGRLDYSFTLAV